jgi:hypothetical protein
MTLLSTARAISQVCNTPSHCISALTVSTADVSRIDGFAKNVLIKPFPPFFEKIFEQIELEQLTSVINQLYPNECIAQMPRNYHLFGRVGLGGSIIGSTLPGGNSSSSSVITAYWAGSGSDLLAINYTCARVGVVQHYILHTVHFQSESGTGSSGTKKVEHVFAYVLWKQIHPNSDFYGVTNTVSCDLFETPAACCFLPVQRIATLAAHVVITLDVGTVEEPIYVTSPLPIAYYL